MTSAPESKAKPPKRPRGEGQWALGYRTPPRGAGGLQQSAALLEHPVVVSTDGGVAGGPRDQQVGAPLEAEPAQIERSAVAHGRYSPAVTAPWRS